MVDPLSLNRTLLAQVDLGDSYKLRPDGPAVQEVFTNPADLISAILPNLYIFAGVLLFIFIFVAGFRIVMSPDNKKAAEDGKKAFFYAIGGFILLLASFWIMQIISALTGVNVLGEL